MMKPILILLLLPIVSISQSYDELKSINDLDQFKKVMIENKYQFDKVDDDGGVIYGFGLVKDEENGNKSEKWGLYNEDGSWSLQFIDRETIIYRYGDYESITESIKDECRYDNIVSRNGVDFVSYRCDDSKFNGTIGFVIDDNAGYIRYFPNIKDE